MMTDTRAAYHKASVLLSHNCVWLLIPNLDPDYYSLHSMLTTRGLFMVTEWWLLGEPPPWARRNYFAQNITNFVMSVPYYQCGDHSQPHHYLHHMDAPVVQLGHLPVHVALLNHPDPMEAQHHLLANHQLHVLQEHHHALCI